MKSIVKRAIREEEGKLMIMVLVLLVVGGLVLAPLLGLASTGLAAGRVYERKAVELYAADAGVEDALWRIIHDEVPADTYTIRVNDVDVSVTIQGSDSTDIDLDLLNGKKESVHSDWVVLGVVRKPGEFEITIGWEGEGTGYLGYVGAWLAGSYSYQQGQAIPDGDIRAAYPNYGFEERKNVSGGTAFIWTWTSQLHRPRFPRNTPAMTLTFQFTPQGSPVYAVVFTDMVRKDVGTSSAWFGITLITARATSYEGSETVLTAGAVTSGCGDNREIAVLSWSLTSDRDP